MIGSARLYDSPLPPIQHSRNTPTTSDRLHLLSRCFALIYNLIVRNQAPSLPAYTRYSTTYDRIDR